MSIRILEKNALFKTRSPIISITIRLKLVLYTNDYLCNIHCISHAIEDEFMTVSKTRARPRPAVITCISHNLGYNLRELELNFSKFHSSQYRAPAGGQGRVIHFPFMC